MLQDFKDMNLTALGGFNDTQYEVLETYVAKSSKTTNIAYSACAIALHIAFCIEVFQYEEMNSEICSIVASGLFCLCHIHNGKENGQCFSTCCILPIYIAGFAIGSLQITNVIVFLFQLSLWQGEYYFYQIIEGFNSLKVIRDARKNQKPGDTNNIITNLQHQLEVQMVEIQKVVDKDRQAAEKAVVDLNEEKQKLQQESEKNKLPL